MQMVREVSAALAAQGIVHTVPFLVEDGPLLVDIALLGPKQNTALQVEGPGQLSVNAPWATLGGTYLLQQTLRNKGWQVSQLTLCSIICHILIDTSCVFVCWFTGTACWDAKTMLQLSAATQ